MTDVATQRDFVKSAEEYRASMRDGRRVYYKGELIEDVVTHPATGGGVICELTKLRTASRADCSLSGIPFTTASASASSAA